MDSGVKRIAKLAQHEKVDWRRITQLVPIPIPSTVMLNSNPVDVAGLPSMDEE